MLPSYWNQPVDLVETLTVKGLRFASSGHKKDDVVLVFLLTLNIFHISSSTSVIEFEQVNVSGFKIKVNWCTTWNQEYPAKKRLNDLIW